ncbi:hypothetical protein SALBM311S_04496 [Streptomyces alboniger]
MEIVHRDEHIVVADKPHFLATTPRGSHVTQSALARLRKELDIPALGAAHRLRVRLTAGLVLFTVRPEERGAYQSLFRDRRVHKIEAVAPYAPELALPHTVRSRIVKERGVFAAYEVPGEPNAIATSNSPSGPAAAVAPVAAATAQAAASAGSPSTGWIPPPGRPISCGST